MFPAEEGDNVRLSTLIETPRLSVSGILILFHGADGLVKGSLINEFGLSFLDFVFDTRKERVKLLHMAKMADKWYIRKVLKRDLRTLMGLLASRCDVYKNERFDISYKFQPLMDKETDSPDGEQK